MMNMTKDHDIRLLRSIILMVTLFASITLLGALFNVFYASALWLLWLLLCILCYSKKIIVFSRPSREWIVYIVISLSFSLMIGYFTVPTIFSGRDQGSISQAAMQLAQSHTLITYTPESTAFFDIYGRGKALNFPGFFYTPDGGLLTQFPLPYTSYLAGFFGIFGTAGLIYANVILLTIFILAMTFITRAYTNHTYTLIFLALLLSSFAIGWFAKFTLSENFTIALLWSTTALYIALKKNPHAITLFTLFITLALVFFSRIEGVWFFMIFLFLLLRDRTIRTFIMSDLWWRGLFPLTTLFAVSCAVAVMNFPFLYTMAQVFVKTTDGHVQASSFMEELSYLFSVYAIYGILVPLILTAVMSAIAIKYKKYRFTLLPIMIVLPLFSYYLFPHISGDHPWMLRRFTFALLPATLLTSIFLFAILAQKKRPYRITAYTIIVILFLTNIPSFISFFSYAENTTLTSQIHQLAQKFNDNDLILVDKNVAGNGWAMITNPLQSLEHKHAVYFFNPSDYEKIDTGSFDHVYLITPRENEATYLNTLSAYMYRIDDYTLTVNQLDITTEESFPSHFPHKKIHTIHGTIYELRTY